MEIVVSRWILHLHHFARSHVLRIPAHLLIFPILRVLLDNLFLRCVRIVAGVRGDQLPVFLSDGAAAAPVVDLVFGC